MNCKTFACVVMLIACLGGMARAQGGTWIKNADGNWSDAKNWRGTVADGSGNTADFSAIDITADRTVHLDYALTSGVVGDLSAALSLDSDKYILLTVGATGTQLIIR